MSVGGINQTYGYNQPGITTGQPQVSGAVPPGTGGGGMMNSQQQGQLQMMSGPRGPSASQEMNFMTAGNRQMGQRGNVPFLQGGPPQQQQQQGMGGPMQPVYGRPNLGGTMSQGPPGTQMTQIPSGVMPVQMQGGQMTQGGGQMSQGAGNQTGMASQSQMAGVGSMAPNPQMSQIGQAGMMGQGQQQRMLVRQQMMLQQQQMGMRVPGPGQQQMHFNPNQQGGY